MLAILLPEQICDNWDEMKGYIREASPDPPWASSERMNDILESLLIGRMTAWISYDEDIKFDGLLIVSVYDDVEGVKTMLIHSLWSGSKVSRASWASGWEIIKRYAISRGCKKVVGYTKLESVKKLVKSMSGSTEYTFCEIDLTM